MKSKTTAIWFVLAAALCGWVADKGWSKKAVPLALVLAASNTLILAMGGSWLSRFVGVDMAMAQGVTPFVLGAVIKSLAVVLMLPGAWRFLDRK